MNSIIRKSDGLKVLASNNGTLDFKRFFGKLENWVLDNKVKVNKDM